MKRENDIYGVVAEFEDPEALLTVARRAYAHGYREMDAYSPFPLDGLAEAIGMRKNRVPIIVLCGGILGAGLAYFLLWWVNVVDYPLNVGGRPHHSWPAFIPITFEMAILFAAFAALLGMLILNRLPELHHPVFHSPNFGRASQDRFFLCIEGADRHFDLVRTRDFLSGAGAASVSVVTFSGKSFDEDVS